MSVKLELLESMIEAVKTINKKNEAIKDLEYELQWKEKYKGRHYEIRKEISKESISIEFLKGRFNSKIKFLNYVG